MPRYPLLPTFDFREDFTNWKSVSDNGGVVTGAPTISNGLTLTGNNTQMVHYPKIKGLLNNLTKWTINIDFTTGTNITNYTDLLTEWDGSGTLQLMAQIISSQLIIYVGGAGNYANIGVSTSTRYKVTIVYDGTQSTNATRLKIYFNGSLASPSYAGTIPAVMTNVSYIWTVCGTNGAAAVSRSGTIVNSVSVARKNAFSAEDALDFYQQDTVTEIDPSKAKVWLPLRSWYYKSNGTQLLTDGDMETAGVAAWGLLNATLTKATDSPHAGAQYLKITGNGATPVAYQNILSANKSYKITGYAKGDGTYAPVVYIGTATINWTGTSSTSWQYFSIEGVASNATFAIGTVNAAGVAGFDDIRVELMEAQTDNIGSLGGYALLGDGSTTTTFPTQLNPHGMSFDGGDYLNIDMGIGPLLTLSMPFTFSVLMYDDKGLYDTSGYSLGGTWDTAQGKGVLFYKYPSTSYGPGVLIGSSSGNFIEARGNEAPPGTHLYTFTYDGSGTFAGLRIYIDGKLSSWINGSTGTLGADIVSGKGVILGARWNGAVSPHQFLTSGKRILDVSIYPFELSPLQVKIISNKLHKMKSV